MILLKSFKNIYIFFVLKIKILSKKIAIFYVKRPSSWEPLVLSLNKCLDHVTPGD